MDDVTDVAWVSSVSAVYPLRVERSYSLSSSPRGPNEECEPSWSLVSLRSSWIALSKFWDLLERFMFGLS